MQLVFVLSMAIYALLSLVMAYIQFKQGYTWRGAAMLLLTSATIYMAVRIAKVNL